MNARKISISAAVTLTLLLAALPAYRMTKADTVQATKDSVTVRQYLVSCVVSAAKTDKSHPLSHPYILVTENQEADLLLGQTEVTLPGTKTLDALNTGLALRFKIIGVERDNVQLDSTVTLNNLKAGDKAKVTILGRSTRTIEVVKLGVPVHLELDGDGSVDLTITQADSNKNH